MRLKFDFHILTVFVLPQDVESVFFSITPAFRKFLELCSVGMIHGCFSFTFVDVGFNLFKNPFQFLLSFFCS